jgi:hypothetical protein
MRFLSRLCLTVIICTQTPPALAQHYATSVVTWLPGEADVSSLDLVTGSPCVLSNRALDLNDALGAPDGKLVSVGSLGFIGFELPFDVVDMPGPDIAVWLSCDTECHNVSIAITHDPASGWGQVGTAFGQSYAEFDIFFSPGDPPVRYVAVLDGSCAGSGGVDVDAVASLQAVVAVQPTTWGSIKALYR